MLPFEDRHTRQRQLPEVGLAGQHRIEAMVVELPVCESSEVARVYLERAGAGRVTCTASAPAVSFPYARYFRHRPAARVGQGTHLALSCIRRQLFSSERS